MYKASKTRYANDIYNRCGTSGLKLPMVSLGLWHNFGTNDNYENMRQMLFTAFDRGITHFDLANNYGPEPGSAEINFGKILKFDMLRYRDEMIISTKAGYTMWDGPYGDYGSRKYLIASLDQSLKRMGLDYVDIFYSHRMDLETPLEETISALATAVKCGKALYAGISNYDGEHTAEAIRLADEYKIPLIINQSRYSILDRHIEKNGLKDVATKENLGIIAFSPLAQGLLTDRYLGGIPDDSRVKTSGRFLKENDLTAGKLEAIAKLNNIAANRGQSLAQMALNWVLKDGVITSVLVGASKPSQIEDSIGLITNTKFDKSELEAIDQAVNDFIIYKR